MRAAWLPFIVGVHCAACAETPHGPLAGASDAWKNEPAPALAPSAVAPRARWVGLAEASRWPRANEAPFTTQGHPPAQQVDVHANEAARAVYGALVADTVFPDGAALAELSHAGNGHGYVMRKADGAWSYLELDERGAVLGDGAPTLCSGCHAQAPADHVFGLHRAP